MLLDFPGCTSCALRPLIAPPPRRPAPWAADSGAGPDEGCSLDTLAEEERPTRSSTRVGAEPARLANAMRGVRYSSLPGSLRELSRLPACGFFLGAPNHRQRAAALQCSLPAQSLLGLKDLVPSSCFLGEISIQIDSNSNEFSSPR